MIVFDRIDLATLHPPFLAALRLLSDRLGARFVVTEGTRTLERQLAVYGQGRTAAEIAVAYGPAGTSYARPDLPRVSNAMPGASAHNWGCAVDVALDGDPTTAVLEPEWSLAATGWRELALLLSKAPALRHGAEWGDSPHIEWRDWRRVRAARRATAPGALA